MNKAEMAAGRFERKWTLAVSSASLGFCTSAGHLATGEASMPGQGYLPVHRSHYTQITLQA